MVIEAATQQQDPFTRTAALAQQADSTAEIKARRAQAEVRSTAAAVAAVDLWDPRVRAVVVGSMAVEVAAAQPQAVAEEDPNSSRLILL